MAFDMQGMMKKAQKAMQQMQKAQEELGRKTVEGSAQGGLVKVTANGNGELVSIKIDPKIVDPDDVEMLEDLVFIGINDALKKAKEMQESSMQGLTGGLDLGSLGLGGGGGGFGNLGGGGPKLPGMY